MGPPSQASGDFGQAAGSSAMALPVVGARADLADVFALRAAGRTRVIYETRPLSEVNEAIDEVLAGRARHAWSGTPSEPAPAGGRPRAVIPPGRPPAYDHGVASGDLQV